MYKAQSKDAQCTKEGLRYSNEDEENVTLLNMLFDEIKTINNIFLSLKNYFDLHIRKRIDDKSIQ